MTVATRVVLAGLHFDSKIQKQFANKQAQGHVPWALRIELRDMKGPKPGCCFAHTAWDVTHACKYHLHCHVELFW